MASSGNSRVSYAWINFVIIMVFSFFCWGCGSGEPSAEEIENQQRQKEIIEAKKLAEKLRNEKPFNFEEEQKRLIERPSNVCSLDADFSFMDLGPNPDFFKDGSMAVYHDKWTNIYVRYFSDDMRKVKIATEGRNPTFNQDLEDPKIVFERFRLNQKDWGGQVLGLTVKKIQPDAEEVQITDEQASKPHFVNEGKRIVYNQDDQYYLIDSSLETQPIDDARYWELIEDRYEINCDWKVLNYYADIYGVWITDRQEQNFNLLWTTKEKPITYVIPERFWIYFYTEMDSGILKLRPLALMQLELEGGAEKGLQEDDLLDVYAKKVSPLTGEVIGYHEDQWKGTLRVVSVEAEMSIAEYQTRLFEKEVLPQDIYRKRQAPSVSGAVLKYR